MCLLFVAIDVHPDFRLIVAANRDEYYNRPTKKLQVWKQNPRIIAGTDLEKGGTWFGVTRQGRWAAVTNYMETKLLDEYRSRGILVRDYLNSDQTPSEFIGDLAPHAALYNGFNLVVGTLTEALYFSNRERVAKPLHKGIFGLSNHLLDTPWPKVSYGKQGLENLVRQAHPDSDSLFSILNDRQCAQDGNVPEPAADIEWDRLLSSAFISGNAYGTRSSTILMIKRDNRLKLEERTYSGEGNRSPGIYSSVTYELVADNPPA